GDITEQEYEAAKADFQDRLEVAFAETHAAETGAIPVLTPDQLKPEVEGQPDASGVDVEIIEQVGDAHANIPDGFTVHAKLKQLLDKRRQMSREGKVDWAFGELLAFGSLLLEGTPVCLVGQDARRGTFVQRHAVFHDRVNGQEWLPLSNLSENQARFSVYDSPLSANAALGFEYGDSV